MSPTTIGLTPSKPASVTRLVMDVTQVTGVTQLVGGIMLAAWLATGVQETGPRLLTDAPDGWRFERLEFPLEFAPDIKYSGYEELRFAPGMFDPESGSYFSYAMAMHLDDVESMDTGAIEDMFRKYFAGLCTVVGRSRNLELDRDDITATVQKEDSGVWHVEVSMVDAFVTGQPLKLNLQVTLHRRDGEPGLFLVGLASPADPDQEIWKQLHGFRAAFK